MEGNYRLGGRERDRERQRERERERDRERERERDEAYSFFIDADWLFRVDVEYLLNALWILESDKPKAPAINHNNKKAGHGYNMHTLARQQVFQTPPISQQRTNQTN